MGYCVAYLRQASQNLIYMVDKTFIVIRLLLSMIAKSIIYVSTFLIRTFFLLSQGNKLSMPMSTSNVE